MTIEKDLLEFIGTELESLNRSIVATPDTRAQLESFAQANQGSMDIVLMQQSIQFGYVMALEAIQDQISKQVITK
tara:strand:+ start:585 stop:809 length:225 start_codon:yes stop_codon:yes gene_type:complete